MPPIKTKQVISVCFFMLFISLGGCGSERNDQAAFDPNTGHANDWLPGGHMAAARSDPGSCSTCHGADVEGGISRVSCTSCHLGGATAVHPAGWVPVYSMHGPYVKTNSTSACANQYCHGLSLTGVANSGPSCTSCHLSPTSGHPSEWNPVYRDHGPYVKTNGTSACANQYCHGTSLIGVADSGPSCSLCHLGGATAVHPSDWTPVYATHGPYAAVNGTGACSNQYCHGPSLTGVADSGPSCTSCHLGGVTQIHPAAWLGDACSNHGSYAYISGTAGCANAACHGANLGGVSQSGPSCTQCHNSIPDSNQCNYCHGLPPNGTAYPNIAGKHAKHVQLNNVACASCHVRSCDQHSNGTIEVAFDAVYNAKTGIASFNTSSEGKTCSEISCHGGLQTPDWYTGTINVSEQCTECHSPSTNEYNGYYSGYHYEHVVDYNKTCTDCHAVDQLTAVHFTGLDSPVIPVGAAAATIKSALGYDGTFCYSASCHVVGGGTYNWWQE
jgi:predicted CxxxxCH...CXXCH cytochrome family protein